MKKKTTTKFFDSVIMLKFHKKKVARKKFYGV